MDATQLTPFVPVIVEATKFLLGEVSKWIDKVRERASVTSPTPATQPKVQQGLEKLTAEPQAEISTITSVIDQSTTHDDIERLQILMKQISLHRSLFNELETQSVLASGTELAKLEVSIREKARVIADKVEELQGLLGRLYKG